MSALLETTSLPGVYSLAETGTHRQSEIESCQRLAHEVAVIMVGSTGPASRPQNDLHGKAFDQRVHDGPSERPRGYGGLRDRRGATGISGDVASQSDLDRVYESVKAYGRKIDVVFAKCRHYSTGAVRYACTDAASVEVDSRRPVRTSMRVPRWRRG